MISQMKNLTNDVPRNETLRKELYETARKLSLALESPVDTVKRIAFEVTHPRLTQTIFKQLAEIQSHFNYQWPK